MGSTITENNYIDIDQARLRNGAVTQYGGTFSSVKSYSIGDVVAFNSGLYLTVSAATPSLTPVGNINYIPYDLGIGSAMMINTTTTLLLRAGNYEFTLQGGGGSGGYVDFPLVPVDYMMKGGGGGGAGYINNFDFKITEDTTINAVVGAGGLASVSSSSDGLPTRIDFLNPQRPLNISSLVALGGMQGFHTGGGNFSDGSGGSGGYGGGGGQYTLFQPQGGLSQPPSSSGQSGDMIFPGQGALSVTNIVSSGSTFRSGGNGGGLASGQGGYVISDTTPVLATSAPANSGAGGGGAGYFTPLGPVSQLAGSGGSGWILIRRKR